MGQLSFSGRSDGAGRLVLVDEAGQEHTLAVDPRLRKALRADGTGTDRSGQLEIPMESTLRPRDIQTRIRAGETPEAVAHAAGTSVEKIMAFAAPVLAERAHVVQRAQLSSVRRRSGESGARTLGEAVAAQLRAHDVDPASVEWDAWRRDDGRWTLTGAYAAGGRTGSATFSFDARGNYVTVDDDDAHWLVGDGPTAGAAGPVPADDGDDLAAVRQRRLNAVPADELPLGADTIEMLADDGDPAAEVGPSGTARDLGEVGETLRDPRHAADDTVDAPAPAPADPATGQGPAGTADTGPSDPGPTDAGPTDQETAEQGTTEQGTTEPAEEAPKRTSKRRGRASVPSWDEIMFGGGKGD